jgi:hypothetical protein
MNINQLPIAYTFTLDQVNLIINSLAKQPYEQVTDLITGIRSTALKAINEAERGAQTVAAEEVQP